MNRKTIHVGYLTRVEGEGSLHLEIEGDQLLSVHLNIFEPPRFFESLLHGRSVTEAPDITARVCGICPVAYQMTAVHAAENLAGVMVDEVIAQLRRLLYCGEWIESHGLHLFLLHLPDFLGYPSLLAMAQEERHLVQSGLQIKKAGNSLVRLLGGREIHPINVRTFGFFSLPPLSAFQTLLPELRQAHAKMREVIEVLLGLSFPDLERDYEFVALRGEGEYPLCRGRVISSRGMDIPVDAFEDGMEEYQVRGSHALYARMRGRGAYLCGPLARLALNFDLLPPAIQDLARRMGLEGGTRNPYRSILVRALEMTWALSEAERIIMGLQNLPAPACPAPLRSGSARAATEAPRGLLYHRYDLDENGVIQAARMIPPTSQNQLSMEEDLRVIVAGHLEESSETLTAMSEKAIRNHDPCISCAAHFLRVTTARRAEVAPFRA